MATTKQMWMNPQALKNAKWTEVKDAKIGYCFIKGRKPFVYYHDKVKGASVFNEVSDESKLIGRDFHLKPTDQIYVFIEAKKK